MVPRIRVTVGLRNYWNQGSQECSGTVGLRSKRGCWSQAHEGPQEIIGNKIDRGRIPGIKIDRGRIPGIKIDRGRIPGIIFLYFSLSGPIPGIEEGVEKANGEAQSEEKEGGDPKENCQGLKQENENLKGTVPWNLRQHCPA